MKALILAAGRGERMRPLTNTTPKPLLMAGNKTLIEHRLLALKTAGITGCVVNTAYLGEKIKDVLKDGSQFGLNIQYSDEGDSALESAGGIIHALPLLGDKHFIVVNADIWTDFDFKTLPHEPAALAHLIMIDNPSHVPEGDFSLQGMQISEYGSCKLTYSGIGVYHPSLFSKYPPGKRRLRPVLVEAMEKKQVSGQHYKGIWFDIGTPERLQNLQKLLK